MLLDGRMTLIQKIDAVERRIDLRAGEGAVNHRNVWHTSDIGEPCRTLFLTLCRGTERAR